jgi:hypothetical protein
MILIYVRLLLLSSLIAATAAGGAREEGNMQTSRRNKEAGWSLGSRESGSASAVAASVARETLSGLRCCSTPALPGFLSFTDR